jgi:aspartate aminotransferase
VRDGMLYVISQRAMELESEGKKIIKFNVGDPDQPTPREIIEAAVEAMKQGKTKYSFYAGENALREKLASIHNVSAENVIIIPGSKWAIFSIIYLLLKNGGNVIIPTPYWTAYELAAKSLGAETRFLKTNMESNWKIDTEKLRNLIDSKTRLIMVNNPNNPTSKIIDNDVLEEIVEIANDNDIPIMSDEVYRDLSFVKTKSILDFSGNHILINSFSKTFAMTGWRIGYIVTGEKLAGKMMKLNQMTFTNVPVFIQEAALKALELKQKIADEIKKIYQQRADSTYKILSKTELEFTKPDCPFYFFPKYSNLDSEKFAFDLLDNGVAVTPGTAFGDYREYFRIALTMPEEEIKLGLEKICEALE